MDDLILTSNHSSFLTSFVHQLSTRFPSKDLKCFTTSWHGLLLTQIKYIQDVLSCTRMFDAKEVHTPLSTSTIYLSMIVLTFPMLLNTSGLLVA